jgi:hypothetical protein
MGNHKVLCASCHHSYWNTYIKIHYYTKKHIKNELLFIEKSTPKPPDTPPPPLIDWGVTRWKRVREVNQDNEYFGPLDL